MNHFIFGRGINGSTLDHVAPELLPISMFSASTAPVAARCGSLMVPLVEQFEISIRPGQHVREALPTLCFDCELAVRPAPVTTPWGASMDVHPCAPGIWFIHTNSHGGFHITSERLALAPRWFRDYKPFAGRGWYEEDCDAHIVVLAFGPEINDSQTGIDGSARFVSTYNKDVYKGWLAWKLNRLSELNDDYNMRRWTDWMDENSYSAHPKGRRWAWAHAKPLDESDRISNPYGVGLDEDEPHDHAYNAADRADRYGRREP